MGRLEDRLRRLEEMLFHRPTADEYLDASNRVRVRALQALAERLEKYGFDGDYLFVEENRRMLATDTPEWQERDRETIEAWRRAHGIDPEMEVDRAKEQLEAWLQSLTGDGSNSSEMLQEHRNRS